MDEVGVEWRLHADRLLGPVIAIEADDSTVVVWYEAPPAGRRLLERETSARRTTFGDDMRPVVDQLGRQWGAVGVAADGSVGPSGSWHPADLWADAADA